MLRRLTVALVTAALMVAAAGVTDASDIVVVDDGSMSAFFGFYGSSSFADQPAALFDDTVAWAVGGSAPGSTTVLLFTYDGTVSDVNPENIDSIGFRSLLMTAGYSVVVDVRANFASRTDYTGINLVIFGNFDYSDALAPSAVNVISAAVPFITMEPGQTDELSLGTGATIFSGTVDRGLVVDNGHTITNSHALGQVIIMAQNGAPGYPYDIPTDTINSSGNGRELIGVVPEPATMTLLGVGGLLTIAWRKRRR